MKLRGPQNSHLFADGDLEKDIRNSMEYLSQRGFDCLRFPAERNSFEGFSFAQPDQQERHTFWVVNLNGLDAQHKSMGMEVVYVVCS